MTGADMERLRLRQICIAVDRLEPVLDRLIEVMGLTVCHGKGDLTRYGVPRVTPPAFQSAFFEKHGITGALLPIGDSFLELIAPLRDDVPVARYLQRRGPGGYMVITEVADTAPARERATAQGIRLAGEVDYPTYNELQLDPRDIGAAILSFSMQREGQPFDGGWFPAGADWRSRAAPGWDGIVEAMLTVKDPPATATRWAAMLARDAAPAGSGFRIPLDNAAITFEAGEGPDRLHAIAVAGPAFEAALARASAAERVGDGILIGGLLFRRGSSWA